MRLQVVKCKTSKTDGLLKTILILQGELSIDTPLIKGEVIQSVYTQKCVELADRTAI
jgi:hypothetical protein